MTINGRVSDKNGAPVQNATIRNTNTGQTKVANSGGNYSIDVNPSDVIEITSIGFLPLQMTSEDLNYFGGNVVMNYNEVEMQNVVIKSAPSMWRVLVVFIFVTIAIIVASKMAKIKTV